MGSASKTGQRHRSQPGPAGVRGAGAGRWWWPLAIAVVVIAAVAPFVRALAGDLVWDDRLLIVEEQRFFEPDYPVRVFAEDFFGDIEEIYRYGYYRPLVSLSYWATWELAGTDPLPYHVTNLVLHAAVSLLVLWIGVLVTGGSRATGLLAALLFAVHPVHVEPVVWVSGRTDLLAALLLGLSCVALLRAEQVSPGTRPRWRAAGWMTAAMGMFTAACLAKEAALFWPAVPVVAALAQPPGRRLRCLGRGGLLALAAVPALWLRLAAAGTTVPSTQWSAGQLASVIATALATLWRYAWRLVVPTLPEPYLQNPLVGVLDPRVLLGAAVAAGLLGLGWRLRRRSPVVWLTGTATLLALTPALNLVRIAGPADMGAPMAQRFLYIPSIPACLLAAWAVVRLLESVRPRTARLVRAAVAVALVAAAAVAVAGTGVWLHEEGLFRRMVEQAPDAPLPHMLLGTALCRDGRWQEGRGQLELADRLLPAHPTKLAIAVKSNLAGALVAVGRLERARELLAELRETSPPTSNVLYNAAFLAWVDGDATTARSALDRALERDPWHRKALALRSRLRLADGDVAGAEEDATRALSRAADDPQALVSLAVVRGRQGRDDDAVALLRRAAAGGSVEAARLWFGWARSAARLDQAETAADRWLALNPEDPAAVIARARVEAARGRTDEALRRLEAFIDRDGASPDLVLAAASIAVASGDAAATRRWLGRAREVAPGDPRLQQLEAAAGADGGGSR